MTTTKLDLDKLEAMHVSVRIDNSIALRDFSTVLYVFREVPMLISRVRELEAALVGVSTEWSRRTKACWCPRRDPEQRFTPDHSAECLAARAAMGIKE